METAALTGAQRAWLKKQAHHLHPLVLIGQQGYTPAQRRAIDEALVAHELIKVKFLENRDQRQQICEQAASELGAILVGIVGNIGIFYRQSPVEEKRRIRIPEARDSHD